MYAAPEPARLDCIELGVDQVTSVAISSHELVLGLRHLVLDWFDKNIAYRSFDGFTDCVFYNTQ